MEQGRGFVDVRSRAAGTGRRRVSDIDDAVGRLGDLTSRPDAVAVITAAGASAVPALRAGLRHPWWRVRHMSARLLDDLPLDDDTIADLLAVARHDSHRKVR